MEQKQQRTPVKMSVSPWKLTLPGKILAVCLCILPFFTRAITLNLPQSVRNAYFLGDAAYSDFEQLCREWFLLAIAAAAVGWFCYEQITLRPKRKLPLTRIMTVVFLFLGIYLLLGLLSSVTSDYAGQTWMGIYMLYEGYLALVGYAVVFAAAWYWIDRKEVLDFTKTCLTVLAIVLGVLALLEHYGMCYYNNFLVQKLGALPGTVGYGDGVVMTFGNADYFGMYCAMLLPLMTALIAREGTTKRLVAQLIAAVLLAAALLQNLVLTTGFGSSMMMRIVRRPADLLPFGGLLTLFVTLTAMITYPLDTLVGTSYLAKLFRPFTLVVVTSLLYVLVYLLLRKSVRLSRRLDHLLPLAAFNNIVVGVALILNHQFVTSFGGAVGFSLGAGAGFVLLAAVLSDGIRRADHPAMPDAFRGLPSALLYMGILALALLGFSGQFSFI